MSWMEQKMEEWYDDPRWLKECLSEAKEVIDHARKKHEAADAKVKVLREVMKTIEHTAATAHTPAPNMHIKLYEELGKVMALADKALKETEGEK